MFWFYLCQLSSHCAWRGDVKPGSPQFRVEKEKKKAREDDKIQLLILPPLIFKEETHLPVRVRLKSQDTAKATCDSSISGSARLYVWTQGLTSYAFKDRS